MGKRAAIKPLPPIDELRKLLDYDPDTGALRWKYVRPNAYRIHVGGIAGTVTDRGYLHVGIARRNYLAHRLIWKMITGEDPVEQIDHADGDRLNNRWANLRQATNGQNRWNTALPKNNKSGVKGVSFDVTRGCWDARVNGRRIGRFKSKEDAISARSRAAESLHGEFARAA